MLIHIKLPAEIRKMRVVSSVVVLCLLHAVLCTPTNTHQERRQAESCAVSGCKGKKGQRGDTGPLGPQGYTGVRGPPGHCSYSLCLQFLQDNLPSQPSLPATVADEPGEAGMLGRTGPTGTQGLKGDTGEPGQEGTPGDSGLPGPPGVCSTTCAGIVGPPSPPEVTGAQSPPTQRGTGGTEGGISRVDVMPMFLSEQCSEQLQGALRLDPNTKQLYYCDGNQWTCLETGFCTDFQSFVCISPYGTQSVGDMWYQVFTNNVTVETQDAADIVLVVDESGSMNREHEWLLIMITLLEQELLLAGVGDGAVRNRYCMVGFGSFVAFEKGHFILIDGEPCFLAKDFPRARAQLLNAGLREDGYQAVDFALTNVPFRDNPFIAKNIILITDEGRTPIPAGAGLSFSGMKNALKQDNILLNVVVWADYKLRDDPDAVVLGVDYSGVSYVLEPEGQFSTRSSPVEITQAEGDTADSYVDLAIAVGGASWALMILRESSITSNVTLQESFTSALTQIKVLEITAQIESCRKCTCVAGEVLTNISCEIAQDEKFCHCVVRNNGDENLCTEAPESVGTPSPGDIVSGAVGNPSPLSSFTIPRAPVFTRASSEG